MKYFLITRRNLKAYSGSIELWSEDKRNSKSEAIISNSKWFYQSLNKIDVKYNYPLIDYTRLRLELNHYTKNELYDFKRAELSSSRIYTGPKPGCATPIKVKATEGEVSVNLEIKGIENLYMLGLNVYPAIGFTNPTWTLMVLAKRLSTYIINKHIKK